jgi:hypothetical protein
METARQQSETCNMDDQNGISQKDAVKIIFDQLPYYILKTKKINFDKKNITICSLYGEFNYTWNEIFKIANYELRS